MPTIPSMNDAAFAQIIKSRNDQNARLNLQDVKSLTDTLKNQSAPTDPAQTDAVLKAKQMDLQKLLQTDALEPAARKVLESMLGTVNNKPVAPKDIAFDAPRTTANSPMFVFFNKGNLITTPIAHTPNVPERTIAPPAVIASSAQSTQTTGPTATQFTVPADASVQLWALPGSTIRIYNASVLEDGKPKLIKEHQVPDNAVGKATDRPLCMTGAYPTQTEFNKDAQTFMAAPHDGMVLVQVPLTPLDDQDARDILKVSMQTPARAESDAVAVRMHSYYAVQRFERSFEINPQNIKLENNILRSSTDYTAPVGGSIALYHNGRNLGASAKVDDNGHFSIDLSSLRQKGIDMSEVSVVAYGNNSVKSVDVSHLGFASQHPDVRRQFAHLDAVVLKNLITADANGKMDFVLDGIQAGTKVEIRNPNNNNTPHAFAEKDGKLHIKLDDVYPGDVLNVVMKTGKTYMGAGDYMAAMALDANGRSMSEQTFSMDGSYSIHEPKDAARIALVIDSLPGLRRGEIQAALDLLGPFTRIAGADAVNDPAKISTLWQGAQIGSALGEFSATVLAHAQAHIRSPSRPDGVDPLLLEGIKMGVAYADGAKKTLARHSNNPLKLVKAGETRTVITGGYSPISGSHGPLRPEYVTGPSTYSVDVPGAPTLTLTGRGQQPSGWVNPAAIGMTFGLTLGDPNSAKFTYMPPPNW